MVHRKSVDWLRQQSHCGTQLSGAHDNNNCCALTFPIYFGWIANAQCRSADMPNQQFPTTFEAQIQKSTAVCHTPQPLASSHATVQQLAFASCVLQKCLFEDQGLLFLLPRGPKGRDFPPFASPFLACFLLWKVSKGKPKLQQNKRKKNIYLQQALFFMLNHKEQLKLLVI